MEKEKLRGGRRTESCFISLIDLCTFRACCKELSSGPLAPSRQHPTDNTFPVAVFPSAAAKFNCLKKSYFFTFASNVRHASVAATGNQHLFAPDHGVYFDARFAITKSLDLYSR